MLKAKSTWLAIAGSLTLAFAASPAALADGVEIGDLVADQSTPEDIVTYGLGPRGQRFSPLDTLNKSNIQNLFPVWSFSFGGEKQRGQESQPLIKDGVMYVTGSYSRMWAVDARTGEELWQYDARLPEGILPCCDVVNRGAAILGDKVFFGTLDAKIVALDAKTGKVVWRKTIADYEAGYSYTAAPLIVPTEAHGPLLITGNSGGEFGIVGQVDARNPETGEIVWTRPVIEGHMGTLNGTRMKPGRVTCGKTVVVQPGLAAPMIRIPKWFFSARVTRHPGIHTYAQVITNGALRVLRSILKTVK